MTDNDDTKTAGLAALGIHMNILQKDVLGGLITQEEAIKILGGIQKYETFEHRERHQYGDVCWQKGECKLYHYAGANGAPLLLVPSLINRAQIFDLCQDRSIARWLHEYGFDVYLLDWGDPKNDPSEENIDDLFEQRFFPAIEFIKQEKGRKIHALGYCLGGTMLCGAAAIRPEFFERLVFLATPWDFHAGSKKLSKKVQQWAKISHEILDQKSYLPDDCIQSLFAMLDTSLTRKKFLRFADMDMGGSDARIFVAVEDWLNDGVDLPAGLAQFCIQDMFIDNLPMSHAWTISGAVINPYDITVPSLCIASPRDNLVDFESSQALFNALKNADFVQADCGHIGMIAGQNSLPHVWEPIAQWLSSES